MSQYAEAKNLAKGNRVEGKPNYVVGSQLIVATSIHFAGAATWAGRKHSFNPHLNEDSGSVGECILVERDKSTLLRIAWVFDGHGPQQIGPHWAPGRRVAQAALQCHQQALARVLPALLEAPLYSRQHPDFLRKSRQALFAQTFNLTQLFIRDRLPAPLINHAGASATCVFTASTLRPAGTISTHLIACNLGDSRAIAMTYGAGITPRPVVLTAEENVAEPSEVLYVKRRCEELGLLWLPCCRSNPTWQKPLRGAWAPPQIHRECQAMQIGSVEELRDALDKLLRRLGPEKLKGEQGTVVYALSAPYVWRLDACVPGQKSGLQMTASVGDRTLEPLKKSTRSAFDVQCFDMRPRPGVHTVVITASDGLWEVVGRRTADLQTFASTVAAMLKHGAATKGLYERVAMKLALWAGRRKRDDVTVTVMGFPDCNLVESTFVDAEKTTAPSPREF